MKKAVLITGASSGIGQATAKKFSENNYFVFLMGRNKSKLEDVALTLPSGASILSCDLTESASVDKRLAEVLNHPTYQTVALVNNAGIYLKGSSLDLSADELSQQWKTVFHSNLLSAVELTQKLIPYFKTKKEGCIVNVSSTLGLRPVPGTGAYSALKAAMISWTQTLALELGPEIRANCVCPGIVDTPIHDFHSLKAAEKEKALQELGKLQPLGRIGSAAEIAESIYFLASPQSAWTTGAVLSVDGGINLK